MEPDATNVTRAPNPLYEGAGADRSILTNPMYGQPVSSRIDGRIKEQRVSRLGVGIMSALALPCYLPSSQSQQMAVAAAAAVHLYTCPYLYESLYEGRKHIARGTQGMHLYC